MNSLYMVAAAFTAVAFMSASECSAFVAYPSLSLQRQPQQQRQSFSFHSTKPKILTVGTIPTRKKETATFTSLQLKKNEIDDEQQWKDFNPFERKKSSTNSVPSILESSTQSLRKMRMQSLMDDLLRNVGSGSGDADDDNDDARLQSILMKHEEFLLEPLEVDGSALDSDSIYSPTMTREERYNRFEEVMGDREMRAGNKSVRKVLGAMKKFVLERR